MKTKWVDVTAGTKYGIFEGYIRYANQVVNISGKVDEPVSNALAVYQIKGNTTYKVCIFMQCRFRLACLEDLTSGQYAYNYIYDPLDINADANIGEYRELEITSDYWQKYLAVGAWGNVCTTGKTCLETLDSIVVYEAQEMPIGSIEVTTLPTKIDYLLEETFKPAGMVVTATYEDGTTEAVTGYQLNGYDKNTPGVQKITVTLGENTSDFLVTVHDLSRVEITTPPTKEHYFLGEKFDATGLVVTAVYDNNFSEVITNYTMSGFDSTAVGEKNVIVTYKGKSNSFPINVHQITGLIITPPTKTEYSFGEPLDTTGLAVSLVCADGYSVVITDYAVSGYNPTTVGEQTVTVSYQTYTGSFVVHVTSTIKGIEITTPPTKISYKQGETFDAAGLVVSAIMQDESKIVVTDYTLSGFDGTVIGKQAVIAEYQGYTASFDVTVALNVVTTTCGTPTLANVTATLDMFTGILTFHGTGGVKAYSSSGCIFSGYKTNIKTVIIDGGITSIGNYVFYRCSNLKTVSLPSTVTSLGSYLFYQCTALEEISNLDKVTSLTSYTFNGCTSLTSLSFGPVLTTIVSTTFGGCTKLTDIHIDREYEIISGSPWGATGATVTWNTYPLARLELLTPPEKTTYRYGESFSGMGTAVRLYYTDESSRDITDISQLTFGGYSASKLGEQTVNVTYRTVSTDVRVFVENYLTGIEVITPPEKINYAPGDAQDYTGLTVGKRYADSSGEAITDYSVADIDFEIYGNQNIVVTYGEFTTFFSINGTFPTTLGKLMGKTENMEIIRNNVKNDDSTDTLTGVSWFMFNGIAVENIYVSGNNWIGFGEAAEQLKICRRDGAVWYERRLEGLLTNGHRFLKFQIEGYTVYNSTSDAYRLVYEIYLFDDQSMFLNVLQTPTTSSYIGVSSLTSGGETQTLTIAEKSTPMISFYEKTAEGMTWDIQNLPHRFLLMGIEILEPPVKTQYRLGETVDLTGLRVGLTTQIGAIEITAYAVGGYDPIKAGTQRVAVTYLEFETGFDVTYVDGFTVRFMYYDSNLNEDVVIDTQTVNYAQSAIPPEVNRPGYVFTGWEDNFTYITWDKDIYADFIPKNICSVIFADYDGTQIKKQFVARGGAATAPEAPVREGYVFAGWSCLFAYITSDITVTALYETRGDSYMVRFLGWNGAVLKSEQVIYGGSATAPTPPERSGYFFLAWDTSYEYVTESMDTQAVYRSNRMKSTVEFYNGKSKAGELKMAIDCTVSQKLNGECTFELTTLADYCKFVQKRFRIEFEDLIFDLTNLEKKTQNGRYLTTIKGEHVSYILNDEDYDIEKFNFTGTPKKCLAKILKGTPFSVGKVDFTKNITLKVNQEATRRDVLMQLVALCGGEIEYDQYKIGIREHIGKTTAIELMDTENVKNVGMSYSAAENTETYSIELYKRVGVSLGDEIHIVFTPLSINKTKRITGLEWNPFDYRSIKVSVGGYRAALSDSLYQSAEKDDATNEKIENLETKMDNLSDTFDSLSGGLGGFNVMSVSQLPANPDMNTIYLIQGDVEVN